MLGELLGESTGKRIVRRVLSTEPPKVEVTFEDSGNMLGVAATGIGTYASVVRADGTILGAGEGIIMTQDGEAITWKGYAQGKFGTGGAVSYRGILFYRTTSQKLAQLNAAPGVFEFEVGRRGQHTRQSLGVDVRLRVAGVGRLKPAPPRPGEPEQGRQEHQQHQPSHHARQQ